MTASASWRALTAAHSTVTINDTFVEPVCRKSGFLGPIITGGVSKVIVERARRPKMARDAVIASHDGYLRAFGLMP